MHAHAHIQTMKELHWIGIRVKLKVGPTAEDVLGK